MKNNSLDGNEALGIFSQLGNCVIKNITIENLYISCNIYAGAFSGVCHGNPSFENCSVINAYIQSGDGQYSGSFIGCQHFGTGTTYLKNCNASTQLAGRPGDNFCGELWRGNTSQVNCTFTAATYRP